MAATFKLDKPELLRRAEQQMQDNFAESRYTARQKIALTARLLHDDGHGVGLAGQVTARGEAPGTFLTQRFGLGFDEITAGNLLLINEDLEVVEGEGVPIGANRFHSWIYRVRPDVNCIVHSHATYSSALGMLGVPLIISQMDTCLLYDDVAYTPDWPGVPFGNEEGEFIAAALGSKRAVLLAHHGLLVAGDSIEQACMLALTFEHAAHLQLLAMAAGKIEPVDPKKGREAHDWQLKPKHSSISFEYHARRCARRHPDCIL
jgi:L-fuculose-phosphate aldolase